MNKYLKISNKGLIQVEDLILMGSSNKRGDSTKIGQFGSGWKYALAYLLRNNVDVRIFSGKEEILLSFKYINYRGNRVKLLKVNDHETSITDTMGEVDWTWWMCLREIISNAIDEGEQKIEVVDCIEDTVDNVSTIYIPLTNVFYRIRNNFEDYFKFNSKPTFEVEGMQMYLKTKGDKLRIFRRGILCLETDIDSKYDLSFDNIAINESRLSNNYHLEYALSKVIIALKDENILLEMLKNIDFNPDWYESDNSDNFLNLLRKLAVSHTFIPKNASKTFGLSTKGIEIPASCYAKLIEEGLQKSILDNVYEFSKTGDYIVVKGYEEQEKEITKELYNLYRRDIKFGKFLNEYGNKIVVQEDLIVIDIMYKDYTFLRIGQLIFLSLSSKDFETILKKVCNL